MCTPAVLRQLSGPFLKTTALNIAKRVYWTFSSFKGGLQATFDLSGTISIIRLTDLLMMDSFVAPNDL